MPIPQELIDELLKDTENPQNILGEDGLLKQLSKAVVAVVGTLLKVLPTDTSVSGTSSAQLIAARNEFESFQIVIQPQAHLMWGVSL